MFDLEKETTVAHGGLVQEWCHVGRTGDGTGFGKREKIQGCETGIVETHGGVGRDGELG